MTGIKPNVMFKSTVVLDSRRVKKDGTYPISIRIYANSRVKYISLKLSVKNSEWDAQKGQIKPSHPSYKQLNHIIVIKHLEIKTCLLNQSISSNRIDLSSISFGKSSNSFYDYWEQEIERFLAEGRIGNATINRTALNAVHNIKSLKIPIEHVDYSFLTRVKTQLLSRGVKLNSVAVYYRALRAVYNSAIKDKLVQRSCYPFYEFKIKTTKTSPRPISIEEMQLYWSLNIPSDDLLFNSWCYGKLIFMLLGINFTDLALLKKDSLVDGVLKYQRAKTKRLYTVKLLPEAMSLVELLSNADSSSLLPLLPFTEVKTQNDYSALIQKRRVLNSHLNKLGRLVGVDNLTSYSFRYSWANIANEVGTPNTIIAQALGHEYGNMVTNIYLNPVETEKVYSANKLIYKNVLNKKRGHLFK